MDWSSVPVLVTGAGGFIGSHLVEALIEHGARVRAFVRYNSRGDIGLLKHLPPRQSQLEIYPGDLRDSAAITRAMKDIAYVFHLGALISIPYSYQHPREVVETNILGTLNVLLAAQENRIKRVVHISTSEVYGTGQTISMREDHILQGQSPYSASKIGADKIAQSFYRSFDLPVVTVRPFNTYGPRQSMRAVIPTIITAALTGETVRLGTLASTRDFTFVKDTASGILRAAEIPNIDGSEINLSSNSEISIGDLARKIIAIIGREVKIIAEDERKRPVNSEVMRLRGDNARAREILNWQPTVSLDEGLQKTITWIAEHSDSYPLGEYQF
ncbi:MAG: SDR family NAD(P)-dependent oxidoreductase [Chloroflexi bacterium]|nr:SDR family NAD(P)-dependent oxidoreductase [Chloroflexota bacterium]